MKSVYNFVVKPIGKRYNNVKKVGDKELILNTEIFNHQYVNRQATVISKPIIGNTNIDIGSDVILHHNVFRRWHNQYGIEKNSKSYFNEDTYIVQPDQIFLYKKFWQWHSPKGFCWVKPIKKLSIKLWFSNVVTLFLVNCDKYINKAVRIEMIPINRFERRYDS